MRNFVFKLGLNEPLLLFKRLLIGVKYLDVELDDGKWWTGIVVALLWYCVGDGDCDDIEFFLGNRSWFVINTGCWTKLSLFDLILPLTKSKLFNSSSK